MPRDRLGRYASAAGGGVLYFLGFIGYGVWPLILVFLAPFWAALEDARRDGPLAAAATGLTFGLVAFAGGFLWLWPLVDAFFGGSRLLGAGLWLAYGLWFAVGFVVYAVLFHGVRGRGWPLAVAAVPPLVAAEWLQPQLFPLYAGNALVYAPAWMVQSADLGGPLLLTGLVAAANLVVLATVAWWRGRRPRPRAAWAAGLAVVLLAFGYAHLRLAAVARATDAAPAVRVGVVQANLGILEKQEQSLVTHRRHLEQTHELLAGGPLDLVVWPETAYVRGLRRPLPISGRPILEDLAVPLLFGGTSVYEEDGYRRGANTAFLAGADGMIADAYDKNLLIPLTEYVPFAGLVPGIAGWFPEVEHFAGAHDTPALRLGPWRVATPICYEAIRPEFVRRMVETSHPHLLITLANDAWFGDSQEPWLHLALARLRAVEHRRFLVRATNSGVSAIVDPAGRVVAATGVMTRANLRGVVRPLEGRTPYARLGDWPGWLSAAVVVLTLLVSAPRRLRGGG